MSSQGLFLSAQQQGLCWDCTDAKLKHNSTWLPRKAVQPRAKVRRHRSGPLVVGPGCRDNVQVIGVRKARR